MAESDIRDDATAWAFARNHIRESPRIAKRAKRRRVILVLGLGVMAAAILSWFGAKPFAADHEVVVGLELLPDGTGIIEVYGNGSPDEIADQLGALLDDSQFRGRVFISDISGREFVQGRLLHDGEDIWMLDQELFYDNTASRIRLDPDATGPILILRVPEGGEVQSIPGYGLSCVFAGMAGIEAERVATERGWDVRVVEGRDGQVELTTGYVEDVLTYETEALFFLVSNKADSFPAVQRCIDDGRAVGLEAS